MSECDKMKLKDHLKECDKLYDNEDYEGLIEKCDEVLSEFPDNQNAIGYKGISLLFLGENQKALEILERESSSTLIITISKTTWQWYTMNWEIMKLH